jgi:hypothetical protein
MFRLLALAAVLFAAAPAAASASTVLDVDAAGSNPKLRTCHATPLAPAKNVRTWRTQATDTGLVVVETGGGADWDIAVFGAGDRFVAAAAGPDSHEVAEGFVAKGEWLTVQACLVRGRASRVGIDVRTLELPKRADAKIQILSVDTPTHADRNRLMALGMDDAHSHTADTLDIVVTGQHDLDKLAAAGFTWTVKEDDLVALDRRRARLDAEFKQTTVRSGFPSGRTEYRHLADYEAEMKKLAADHPNLVKLITLPYKSLEGRAIMGVEITQDVKLRDGKPAFVQFGVHHAREWPSGEHAMEWAYEMAKGYGKDPRVTNIVNSIRTIVVPIVNPDGFNLSREEPVDTGNATAAANLPPDVNSQLPISDPGYTASILADQEAGRYAYKRRNCRLKDGEVPEPGQCALQESRLLGVDNNRNYGQFWGGPGASLDVESDTYRGAGPFSEPENENVRWLISHRQVATMITNHTFSNLVLRPPGIKSEGATPDEEAYKALGDTMAAQNGYSSQFGYQLYDTTGTTEDWSYYATGGFGFTFEIGPNEFHPPFEQAVAEWDGAGQYAGKGNRAAYFIAAEHTVDSSHHSVLEGRAKPGTVLRLHKEFMSSTSPVIMDESGNQGRPMPFKDVLDTTMVVPRNGRFEWHVNPSTRPYVKKARVYSGVADKPAFELDISSPVPVPPGVPREIEFEVKPGAARQIRASITSAGPDYDIYLYQGSVDPDNQVASSAGGTADETIAYGFPVPGKYVLEIVNYSAIAPYDGKIEIYGEKEGTVEVTKRLTEVWMLTCETEGGKVLGRRKVQIDRGLVKNLGRACVNAVGTKGALKLKVRVRKVRGKRVVATARCSRRCTATASLRLGKRVLSTSRKASFKGKRAIRVRLTRKAQKLLATRRATRLRLVVFARDGLGNVRTRTVKLRRRK